MLILVMKCEFVLWMFMKLLCFYIILTKESITVKLLFVFLVTCRVYFQGVISHPN